MQIMFEFQRLDSSFMNDQGLGGHSSEHISNILNERYQLIGEIGNGAMGDVFKSNDLRLDRYVAIKILKRTFTDDQSIRARFEREARAAGRLSHHPHVVTVFDVSETNGRPFIVMELVEGGTLASLMRSQKLSVDRAVEIVRQVLSALEFAHESGILHRDIKPSNILMGNNGQAKVSDFGIATILDSAGELDLTMTSGVIGTPAYLSPERAEGSKEITPASDLFSVGVILYEMLTGQKPFSGESPLAVLLAAKSGKFQAPEQLNPEIPPYVSQVIKRSLSPSPQERYLSAAQMAAALDPNYVMESTVGFSGFGMPLSQVDSGLSDERTQVWVAAEAGSRMGSDPTIVESGSGGLGAGRLARDGLAGAGIIGFLLLVKNRCLELAGKLNSYFRDEVSPKTRAALGLAALAIAGFIVASILFFGHGGSGGRATTPTTSIVTTTTSTSTTTTSTTSTTVVPTTIVPTTVPPGPARSGPPGFLKKGH